MNQRRYRVSEPFLSAILYIRSSRETAMTTRVPSLDSSLPDTRGPWPNRENGLDPGSASRPRDMRGELHCAEPGFWRRYPIVTSLSIPF